MIQTTEAADTAAAVSATLATVSWIADLNAVLTLVATLTAIVAGASAALYHLEAWRQKRRERK
jgi:hypothetical protein